MTLITERASTLSEAVAAASRICDAWLKDGAQLQEAWYRGQCHESYALTPSVYRQENIGFVEAEPAMLHRFQGLATPLLQRTFDEWEWYFLARHHSVPTRLLDWTESLLVAMRFALTECSEEFKDRDSLNKARVQEPAESIFDAKSPVIWILEAGTLNKFSLGLDSIVIPGGDKSASYLPDVLGEKGADSPIAILPTRSNPRLAAQRGMFTVHGRDRRPLDQLAQPEAGEQGKPHFLLAKIILDRARSAQLLWELEVAGMDRFGLFPDLDSVGEQVCWEYKR